VEKNETFYHVVGDNIYNSMWIFIYYVFRMWIRICITWVFTTYK